MAKEKRKRIFAKKIDELGLRLDHRNELIFLTLEHSDPKKYTDLLNIKRSRNAKKTSALFQKYAGEMTVKQVMGALEEYPADKPPAIYFIDRLRKMRLTYLEWHKIPPETASQRLGGLPKNELLTLPIRAVGRVSNEALRHIAHHLKKQPSEITVRDIITKTSIATFVEKGRNFKESFHNLRSRLAILGFGYDDGMFFQVGTEEWLIDELRKKYKITRTVAKKVVHIARDQEWITFLYIPKSKRNEAPS